MSGCRGYKLGLGLGRGRGRGLGLAHRRLKHLSAGVLCMCACACNVDGANFMAFFFIMVARAKKSHNFISTESLNSNDLMLTSFAIENH